VFRDAARKVGRGPPDVPAVEPGGRTRARYVYKVELNRDVLLDAQPKAPASALLASGPFFPDVQVKETRESHRVDPIDRSRRQARAASTRAGCGVVGRERCGRAVGRQRGSKPNRGRRRGR
jgi:hypothetical protein